MTGENNTEATTTYRDKARPKAKPVHYRVKGSLVEVTRWDDADGDFHLTNSRVWFILWLERFNAAAGIPLITASDVGMNLSAPIHLRF